MFSGMSNLEIIGSVCMLLLAYFVGNISPAILIAKSNGIDIRKEGSGNAGTTNVLRTLGKPAAVITLIVDIAKGVIPVIIANMLFGDEIAGYTVLAVCLGHVWPVCFGFRGGKGVATTFGALMGFDWQIGLMALLIVAIGVVVTRKMSFGSVVGAATLPVVTLILHRSFVVVSIVLALVVLFKHRSNIKRLIKGTEPKIGAKKEENFTKNMPQSRNENSVNNELADEIRKFAEENEDDEA